MSRDIRSNIGLASDVVRSLASVGVREFVVCAGARNAPLVQVLSKSEGFKIYSFFEERSAAFFALGRILSTGLPCAVVTTSGTAVANLLPATIEADYQALPLVLVSADRPTRFRGSGSPQTIVQPGLFSNYIEQSWDIESTWAGEFRWSLKRPVHVNVCFDEPLFDADVVPVVASSVEKVGASPVTPSNPSKLPALGKKPLIVVSGLSAKRAEEVLPVLKSWQRPVWLEATSRLRQHPDLENLEVRGGDVRKLDFDSVIRIGGVPTFRSWRDLEVSKTPVLNFSDVPFSGLARDRQVFGFADLPKDAKFEAWSETERQLDVKKAELLQHLLMEFSLSEPAWFKRLSEKIPTEARIFLGNSLPIREWDLAAKGEHQDIWANRGVNGIDGLVSTFYGLAASDRPNWAVLGDLSTLYDLTGPWALRERPNLDATIAIVNNGGGKIFERMFRNPMFENRHDMNFKAWAEMWNLSYARWESADDLNPGKIIEIIPSNEHTAGFWRAWEQS